MNLSLYVENLFNKQYYVNSLSNLETFPGAPFNLRGALRWEF
jgi:outer membrane receptor protein involved in Fe transport